MTHVTCRLTAKNRDQLRNRTLGNRVLATFTFFITYTNFGDHRLRSFGWRGSNFPLSIDFHRRAYNTLALLCECDKKLSYRQETVERLVPWDRYPVRVSVESVDST